MKGIKVNNEYRFAVISGNDILLSDEEIPFSKFCDTLLVDCEIVHNFHNIPEASLGVVAISGNEIQYEYSEHRIYGELIEKYAEMPIKDVLGRKYLPSGILKLKEAKPYKLVALDIVAIKENDGIITLQRTRN